MNNAKKSIKCLFCVFIIWGQFFQLLAQSVDWYPLKGPWGINAIDVVVTDAGYIYIQSNVGIVRSVDKGKTWDEIPYLPQQVVNNLVDIGYVSMAPAPDGGIYFLASYGNLYKLSFGSKSWEKIEVPFNFQFFNVNPQGEVFLVSWLDQKIYRSKDGNKTFQLFYEEKVANDYFNQLYCEEDQVFVFSYRLGQSILRIISNNGNVVQKIDIPYNTKQTMIKSPSGKYLIYNRLNESRTIAQLAAETGTWKQFEVQDLLPGEYLTYMFYNATASLYLQTSSGRWLVSKDDGETWSPSNLPVRNVDKIAYSPDKEFCTIVSSCSGDYSIYMSRDDLKSVESVDENFLHPLVFDIQKDGHRHIYAGTCPNYRISNDNGVSWDIFTLEPDISVRRLYFTSNYLGFALGEDGLWRVSEDHGDTWLARPEMTLDSIQILHLVESHQKGLLYGYSWVNSTIYKTTNAGKTWIPVGTPPKAIFQMAMHPNGNLYCVGESIYKSVDGGKTWEELPFLSNADATPKFVHITQTGVLILGFYPTRSLTGSYISKDEGKTAKKLPDPYPSIDHQMFFSNRVGDIIMTDYDGVSLSQDQGDTWVSIEQGLPKVPSVIYFDKDNYLYAGIHGYPIYQSFKPISYVNRVIGHIFEEKQVNCMVEPNEKGRPFYSVYAKGTAEHYRVSDFEGNFSFGLPEGVYEIQAIPHSPLWAACSRVKVQLAPDQQDSVKVNLGLHSLAFCAHPRVEIVSERLRRCFSNTYHVRYSNEGTTAIKQAEIKIKLDSLLEYESADLPLVARQGQIFTFAIGDLPPEYKGTFHIKVKVSCEAPLGFIHCTRAEIGPSTPCPISLNPNHIVEECRVNTGSYDPNDKQAFVKGRQNFTEVPLNTEIDYFIRFQNTGTDTAFTVVVSDQLSPHLDLKSIRPGLSSHPYRFEMREDRQLRFIFDDIALPDSNTNLIASNGFVKFSITPLDGLPDGVEVENTADIYFDFNEPVRTNTVKLVLASVKPPFLLNCIVAPNPATDQFEAHLEQSDGRVIQGLFLEMFDAMGRRVLYQQMEEQSTTIYRSGLPSGLYWMRIGAKDGRAAVRKIHLK